MIRILYLLFFIRFRNNVKKKNGLKQYVGKRWKRRSS